MKPDRYILNELKKLDENLSVQWNGRKCRWEVFYRRHFLRPSERKRFSHIATFYDRGVPIKLYEPKPIDRWHICFWEGDNGEFRTLDYGLILQLKEWDNWRHARTDDIWLAAEKEEYEEERKKSKEQKEMFRDIALENDGALRKQMDDFTSFNKRGWHVWTPTNHRVGIDFKNKKKKVKT